MKNVLSRREFVSTASLMVLAASCGSNRQADSTPDDDQLNPDTEGVRLVSAADGSEIHENPPDGLVVLDVRTAEEFAEGHLDGATMLDFYRDDFAEQLAKLDPDVPYLLYCRSGNRSGQSATLMTELGFSDVAEIDGGILSWNDSGLPTATG